MHLYLSYNQHIICFKDQTRHANLYHYNHWSILNSHRLMDKTENNPRDILSFPYTTFSGTLKVSRGSPTHWLHKLVKFLPCCHGDGSFVVKWNFYHLIIGGCIWRRDSHPIFVQRESHRVRKTLFRKHNKGCTKSKDPKHRRNEEQE